MGSGLRRSTRALAAAVLITALAATTAAPAAVAASQSGDSAIARAGAFVASDLPATFEPSAASSKSHTDNVRLAKGVDGCGPYVTVQKAVTSLPQVKSPSFADDTRTIGNEVDVFPSDKAASAALVLYAKSSVVGCLENLFEKQARQDPDLRDSLDDVVVNLDRQDIAGLGDDSVVYEGSIELTGTDGSTKQIGIGSAAVRVGRAANVVTYSTAGDSLTDVLTPAIDASVSRLRSALARSGS
ncbi:MAG TPA: hypothetical protein VGN51_04280 [Acidimicrobiia bacterium]|jgi:hypothetical protein